MPDLPDIDRIVREVLAQLGQSSAAQPTALIAGPAAKLQRDESKPLIVPPAAADCLEIGERVVTLATLDNRLSGIRRVRVRPNAVVTPAARDALAELGVEVERSATAAQGARALALGVALLDRGTSCDVAGLVAALVQDGIQVERLAETGLANVVADLAERAALSGQPAVLLTSRPEGAACLANRRNGVRAVAGRDLNQLRRAVIDVGANLLAVDPAGLGPVGLRRLLGELCNGAGRPCPAELSGR